MENNKNNAWLIDNIGWRCLEIGDFYVDGNHPDDDERKPRIEPDALMLFARLASIEGESEERMMAIYLSDLQVMEKERRAFRFTAKEIEDSLISQKLQKLLKTL